MPAVHFLGRDRIPLDTGLASIATYGSRSFVLPEFNEMMTLVRRGLPVERVVTHRFALAEAGAAFALFRSAECGKIVFTA